MSVKSDTSQLYLENQKQIHGKKRLPEFQQVLLTGTKRERSIGDAINDVLANAGMLTFCSDDDVRKNDFKLHRYQNLTALVMCHGVTHLDWFEDAPLEKLKEIIDVNLTGTIVMTQSFVQNTIRNSYRKTIISIGSMAYKSVLNGSAVYCSSKAGQAHLMRCLAWELAPKGYDVYCIHPSNTLGTPMSEETIQGLMRYRQLSREAAEAYWNDSAIRDRSLTTKEIADLVCWLLSGNSPYLSGCQLELGGGQR